MSISISVAGCLREDLPVTDPVPSQSAVSDDCCTDSPVPALMFPAIHVVDMPATESFYVDMLGMQVTLRLGGPEDEREEVTLGFGDSASSAKASLVLHREGSRREPYVFDGFSRLAFRVADVEALVSRIERAGHTILQAPRLLAVDDRRIKLAFVEDPNGARVELIELLPSDEP
jgi:catechol 2,3-dioxygenase-like lactoylglutathione lyase family enzyme